MTEKIEKGLKVYLDDEVNPVEYLLTYWAVNDSGPLEDEEGLAVVIEYVTKKGKEKLITLNLSENALLAMLYEVRKSWSRSE